MTTPTDKQINDLITRHEVHEYHPGAILEFARALLDLAAPKLDEIEQYRMQMAGISTAALGYWKESDGIHPDYDTVPLRDVAKLYAKYDELYRMRVEAQANPPQPAAPSLTVGEREAFEAWARGFSTLSLERDSHGHYVSMGQELLWLGFQAGKGKAPAGASLGESNADAGLGLAGPDSACAHDFALQPSSSIRLCAKCGIGEVAARAALAPAAQAEPVADLTPEQLADKCEAWLQTGTLTTNVVDAYEAGYRDCEAAHAAAASKQPAQGVALREALEDAAAALDDAGKHEAAKVARAALAQTQKAQP